MENILNFYNTKGHLALRYHCMIFISDIISTIVPLSKSPCIMLLIITNIILTIIINFHKQMGNYNDRLTAFDPGQPG